MLTNDIYQTIASHSSDRIGLLDTTATLEESNQHWLDFFSTATTPPENLGVDYIKMFAWESGNTNI
ncbi:MAG: hypothetical protein PF495_15850 [Spirochaetales bacterium]|jgi:hypothetical protein|nr:hypothetical protein [Spirochaetales bacterium]